MLNPDDLVDAIVAKIKLVSGFMAYMANDAANVKAYTDDETGVLNAVGAMEAPSTLVMWQELEEVSEGQAAWTHRIEIAVRPLPNQASPNRFGAVLYALINGVPAGGSKRLFADVDTPDVRWEMLGIPQAVRSVDEQGVEYILVSVRYRQKGDN